MNAQRVAQFFETMSRSPELRTEFAALAARYGIDLADDQLSEAELAKVSGGGDMYDGLLTLDPRQGISQTIAAISDASKTLHDAQMAVITHLKA